MLVSLSLNNLALIDAKEVSFDGRFNVITGETGAGKSLILDALSLCTGERADSGIVRHGHDEASVFGEFDVSNNDEVAAWFAKHERELKKILCSFAEKSVRKVAQNHGLMACQQASANSNHLGKS